MAFNFLSLLPTAIGLIQGLGAQKSADNRARTAEGMQREQLDRILKLFDKQYGMVEELDKQGHWDPSRRIAQLEADTARYQARDSGNMAGAYRRAGYKPGDSAIEKGLTNLDLGYRQHLNQMREQIRSAAAIEKLGAYGSVNPGSLGAGLQVASQNLASARADRPNFSALLGSMMPFLANLQGSGVSRPNPAQPSGYSLGTGGFMNFQPFAGGPYKPGKALNVSF